MDEDRVSGILFLILQERPSKAQPETSPSIITTDWRKILTSLRILESKRIECHCHGIHFALVDLERSRILPNGRLPVNEKGIEHYKKEMQILRSKGISIMVTLFHWDLPQSLQDEYQGFSSRQSVGDFATYARICFEAFAPYVQWWSTFNEPWTYAQCGHAWGVHAPGHIDPIEPFLVGHHMLLAHAEAVKIYRSMTNMGSGISIALNSDWCIPATDSDQDRLASQTAVEFSLGWFADPIYFGDYPAVMKERIPNLPQFTEQESKFLRNSVDFLCFNHYTTQFCENIPNVHASDTWQRSMGVTRSPYRDGVPIGPKCESTWLFVYPPGIYHISNWISNRYGNPDIFITENGCDIQDEFKLKVEDAVHDVHRINYYRGYLDQVLKAISSGVSIKGYFAWTLFDNFEWGEGYKNRFGIYYVDFADNNKRYPKDSALWYRDLCHTFHLK
eukprot:TRINITY_DN2701_c0_g1_i2.p1 TRINITY_DN2701_c0_g1~~TRINITY_DN2701_c0_g1_i2.p1  ORF type:complete len:446 (+),score=74.02 TRINITY_DN2701_c0_g1_i2:111-1448(+)